MEKEKLDNKLAELEALLFIHGEPLPVKKIASILDIKNEEIAELLEGFKQRLEAENRGLTLVMDGEKVQLATKAKFGKILEKFVKDELSEELTPASLETLSAIIYFAPITRSRLEYLRGVNSSFILRSLLLRGLVERFPDPLRQNQYLYRPTFELLKHIGLEKREDMPDFEKFQSLMKAFEAQQTPEQAQGQAQQQTPEQTQGRAPGQETGSTYETNPTQTTDDKPVPG
ncbi:MAG: SMC-Scp complex subunit ScpB [Candidatus Liptonbacteria bacterium]|nr:SMC-Scp complex subunit ScpB [Candidatus Liptonbacteria bacterium]